MILQQRSYFQKVDKKLAREDSVPGVSYSFDAKAFSERVNSLYDGTCSLLTEGSDSSFFLTYPTWAGVMESAIAISTSVRIPRACLPAGLENIITMIGRTSTTVGPGSGVRPVEEGSETISAFFMTTIVLLRHVFLD